MRVTSAQEESDQLFGFFKRATLSSFRVFYSFFSFFVGARYFRSQVSVHKRTRKREKERERTINLRALSATNFVCEWLWEKRESVKSADCVCVCYVIASKLLSNGSTAAGI